MKRQLPLLLLLLFGVAFFFPKTVRADRIEYWDGRTIHGRIVEESDTTIKVETRFGVQTIDREKVKGVVREKAPAERFQEKREACPKTVSALLDLAAWCKEKDLGAESRTVYADVLDLDPENETAHRGLGHVLYEGVWVTPAQKRRLEKEKAAASGTGETTSNGGGSKNGTSVANPIPKPTTQSAMFADHEGVDWSEAHVLETRHYRIKSNVKRKYVKEYARFLEALAHRFRKVFRYRGNDFRYKKNEVWIYKSREEFMANEGQGMTTLGFYEPWSKRIKTFHGRFSDSDGNASNTFGVLAHEGTHQFENLIVRQMNHAPIWLLEGLAVFFEATERRGREVQIGKIPVDRWTTIRRAFDSDTNIKFSALIRTPQAEFGGFHYAHAWALIHWMVYSDAPNARRLLDEFWALCKTRPTRPKDFVHLAKQCGYDMQELEASVEEWINNLDTTDDPALQ